MSMKMFFLSSFGLIKPTAKIEQEHEHLLAAYKEYCIVEQSDELKEYTELESFVQSDEFARKKNELENLKYKGSQEEALLKEFTILSKNKKLQKFFVTKNSAELKRFNQIAKSESLSTYFSLKKFMEEGEFQSEKEKSKKQVFKGSEEEKQLKEYLDLQKSKAVKTYFKIKDSAELKQSIQFSKSETLKKYVELKAKVELGKYLNEKEELAKLKSDSKIKDYFRFTGSKKYKIYKETIGTQLINQYLELQKIAEAEQKKADKRTPEEEKAFKKTETYSHLRKFKRLKRKKKLIVHFQISESPEMKKFLEFELSETLKHFHELEKKVKSGNYIDELADLKKLKNSSEIKTYFRFIESPEYKLFCETENSKTLSRFNELKQLTESNAFLNRKAFLEDSKKFEKTDAFKKSNEYKKLKESEDLKFYFKYEKSPSLKNYLQMENSKEKTRYEELKAQTESAEFLQRKAYLEDPKKWEKTDEYKKLQQYLDIKKKPHIERYFKYKTNDDLDFFKSWELVFFDEFKTSKIDSSKWQTVSYRASQSLEKNYSQPGDLQAFTSGANIKTDGNTIKIETRKENTKGLVWQLPFGFVEKDFGYSSGCINNSGSFWSDHGIWEAKVKYAPVKGLASAVYLLGENNCCQVNLLETGIRNRVGLLRQENGQAIEQTTSISGLKTGQFYIFSLEWTKEKMTWKINNKVIFSLDTQKSLPEMHINAATIVVDEISNGLPYYFEIDWIRVYHQK